MSDASRVKLSYIEESTYGVTPSGNLDEVRFTSESLNFALGTTQSNEIRADRNVPDLIQTSFQSEGAVEVELSYNSLDDWIEAALFADSTWSTGVSIVGADISVASNQFVATITDFVSEGVLVGHWIYVAGFTDPANNGYFKVTAVTTTTITVDATLVDEPDGDPIQMASQFLKNGVTRKSYSIEKFFSDVGQYISFVGMIPGNLDLSFAAQSIVTGSVGFLGAQSSITQASIGTGYTAANTNEVMNTGNHVGLIKEGTAGLAVGVVQTVSFSLNNNLRGLTAIGVVGNADVQPGQCSVTGSMDVYFTDEVLYEKVVNGTASSLVIQVADGSQTGKGYVFEFPKIKFSSGEVVTGGNNQDVIATTAWQAIYDSATDSTVRVFRFGG